jgi:hypothetical protein
LTPQFLDCLFYLNRIVRLLLFSQRAGLLQSGVVLAENRKFEE